MMSTPLKILITGAGAPGIRGTLYSLEHNLDRRPVSLIGVDANPSAVGQHFMDGFEVIPLPSDPGYVAKVLQICKQHGVQVILPQTTREIFTFSRELETFANEGVAVAVASAEAIALANNKGRLLRCFEELKLPHPEFHLATCRDSFIHAVKTLGYPNVPVAIKPPVSNGMRGFRVLKEVSWNLKRFFSEKPSGIEISFEQLLEIFDEAVSFPEMIVSEYLPGIEYSVDAFIGKHCEVAIPRIRKVIRSGISFETVIEQNQQIIDFTLKAAQHIGLVGAFGFQFKMDRDGVPKVLECNPRVQGTMVASVLAGTNVIWAAIREALGDPLASLPPPKSGSMFCRFWGGIGFNDEGSDVI